MPPGIFELGPWVMILIGILLLVIGGEIAKWLVRIFGGLLLILGLLELTGKLSLGLPIP